MRTFNTARRTSWPAFGDNGGMPGPIGVTPAPLRPTTPGATPPKTVDTSAIDVNGAEFKKLPPSFQQAVRDAKAFSAVNFRGMTPAPKVLVTAAASNGQAPVSVIVPPNAQAPFTVQTHYHGDGARSLASNPAADAIATQVKRGDSTVFVLPEAAKPGAPTDWTNVRRIGDTTTEALAAAGVTGDVGQQTLSVHSAGGRALMYAVKNGESLKADRLVIQDALFESNSGRGAATFLKQQLPQATGVGRITLVPSTGPGAAGLMKDLDEPSLTRTQVLARELKAAGRTVDVVNVATHDDAAKQLAPKAGARDGWVP